MSNLKATKQNPARGLRSLQVGFVPLIDCAPLVMAQELGLFAKHGLAVTLSREVGWATLSDKIIYGKLDAAHSLAALPFAATLGLGSIRCECLTGLVLNLHGNAITLSNELWNRGVRDAKSLKLEIDRERGRRTYTFGVVYSYSSHNFLLRQWLTNAGINPDKDVRIVVVPPPSMVSNLKSGNLDGYCVGEPWSSVAVNAGIGWVAATSAQLSPLHPEKVLMVRRRFADEREGEHLALIAALYEACNYCDQPSNQTRMIEALAKPQYLNVPAEILRGSMIGPFDFGHGRSEVVPNFTLFHRYDANEPNNEKAAWILRQLISTGAIKDRSVSGTDILSKVFRSDIFQQAIQRSTAPTKHEIESETETVCR